MNRISKVLTSLTFRYIAKYLAVLTFSVFVLLGALYSYFSYTYFGAMGDSIVEELETLELIYNGQSMEGVNRYLDEQYRQPVVDHYYYLVLDEKGNKIAGDLDVSPSYREFAGGWLGFELALLRLGESVDVDFIARRANLSNGYQLMVARNYADLVEKSSLVFQTLFRALVATLILGLIGGFFSASSALSRIEDLNQELSGIIRSDRSGRLQLDRKKGYVRDLSVMMNSMLEQLESLMLGVRRVSDNIAHDLRTPLTRLRNQLSQLQANTVELDKEPIERMINDCDDLLSSFNALLRISTLESGSKTAARTEVSLHALLQDVVELYEPLAQEKNVDLTIDVQPLVVTGEADLLFQMFANLLDNAVKYTNTGGDIGVSLTALEAGGAQIDISDSGPGVPEVEMENVFQRFYRVESSRSEQPGNGLGLSLVRAIAHYHEGEVNLLDNNPGLRVQVVLPRRR